ncbi:hypothetical protein BpHYR1_000474 [Brachionus plicatilis]|uniref:Uncharacterized protein n=1 Tax=Brachionus plicatilis TaxID=10195 RepID=A0A3M7RMY8_BRAPC|nr:hypothetical protein BpHYR1_000474 [Brachionus plicatilis]
MYFSWFFCNWFIWNYRQFLFSSIHFSFFHLFCWLCIISFTPKPPPKPFGPVFQENSNENNMDIADQFQNVDAPQENKEAVANVSMTAAASMNQH